MIGLGVGERHVAGYELAPECDVVAVCDLDKAHADAVAARHGVPTSTSSWRDITEHAEIDVVSICSYDDAHVEQAVSALDHGKHVMVEKPIALTRADAATLLAAHQRHPELVLTSNLILRASPRFRRIHQMARRGDLGRLFYLEADYLHDILWKLTEGWRGRLAGYSVIYGGGVHMIDLMRWIVGEEITHVSGLGGRLLVDGSDFPGHDTTVNLFRFEGGALAKCTTSLGPRRPKFHRLDVYGTKATFINGPDAGQLYPSDDPADTEPVNDPYPGMQKGDLLSGFLGAIRGAQPLEVTPTDIFRVMDVCFTAQEAVESRETLDVRYSL